MHGDNVASGTSTTGVGTLTLASPPAGLGVIDHYVWATAQNGFGNTKSLTVPYSLVEYTNTAMVQASKLEAGWGTLTLGTSLTGCTFARDRIVQAMNVATPSFDAGATPSAISIGTAANTLLILGNSALTSPMITPWNDQSLTANSVGVGHMLANQGSLGNNAFNIFSETGANASKDVYFVMNLFKPVFAKVMRCVITRLAASGTPTPNSMYGRIYAFDSNGKPGRLLCDFGTFGTNPLSSGTAPVVLSATATTGIWLPPSEYWINLFCTLAAETTHPALMGMTGPIGLLTMSSGTSNTFSRARTATGGTTSASDPANVTGWALGSNAQTGVPVVGLAPS